MSICWESLYMTVANIYMDEAAIQSAKVKIYIAVLIIIAINIIQFIDVY